MKAEHVIHEKWPIPTEFPVVIASNEVGEHTYRAVVGSSGLRWYVPTDIENVADCLYVTEHADWNKSGTGFGGRDLSMKMEDGTTETLRGGWHSNAIAFKQDTGEDVLNKHKTFVVIAERRDAEFLYDVIYADEAPQISEFRRGELMAKELAKKLNKPLVCFSRARTGAVIGMVYP